LTSSSAIKTNQWLVLQESNYNASRAVAQIDIDFFLVDVEPLGHVSNQHDLTIFTQRQHIARQARFFQPSKKNDDKNKEQIGPYLSI
jgi:hypothetical protein